MSSHHIVKEDQEPALLIARTDEVPFSIVQELLEWSPTVMVLENALPEVLLWGIKIDVVIGIEDHVNTNLELLSDQAPVKILSYKAHEDPFVTALYFLAAEKHKAVNVVGEKPKSFTDFTKHVDVVVFDSTHRWSFARQGKFEKWISSGATITWITEENNQQIQTDGLDTNQVVRSDGLVRLVSDGPFWVGEVY